MTKPIAKKLGSGVGVILLVFLVIAITKASGSSTACKPYDMSMTGHENQKRVEACLQREKELGEEHDRVTAELRAEANKIRSWMRTEEAGVLQEAITSERPDVKLGTGMIGNRED